MMYNQFRLTYPNIHFSYYFYIELVSSLKISFVKPGHSRVTFHKKDVLSGGWDESNKFADHKKRVKVGTERWPFNESNINSMQIFSNSLALAYLFVLLPSSPFFHGPRWAGPCRSSVWWAYFWMFSKNVCGALLLSKRV